MRRNAVFLLTSLWLILMPTNSEAQFRTLDECLTLPTLERPLQAAYIVRGSSQHNGELHQRQKHAEDQSQSWLERYNSCWAHMWLQSLNRTVVSLFISIPHVIPLPDIQLSPEFVLAEERIVKLEGFHVTETIINLSSMHARIGFTLNGLVIVAKLITDDSVNSTDPEEDPVHLSMNLPQLEIRLDVHGHLKNIVGEEGTRSLSVLQLDRTDITLGLMETPRFSITPAEHPISFVLPFINAQLEETITAPLPEDVDDTRLHAAATVVQLGINERLQYADVTDLLPRFVQEHYSAPDMPDFSDEVLYVQ